MMNIEQITSRLAQMPDQALQKYAMMHKEDPYIMALAISESRRRKQMRAAASAPQLQAQPKVADRALMEMGVDALPAGEMDFAGGGIVAFADGGDVERYSGEFGSLTGGTLDEARARAQAAQQKLYTYGLRQRQQDPAGFQTAQQELTAAQAALQAAEQKYAAEMSASGVGRAAFGKPTTPLMPAPAAAPAATATPGPTPQELAQFDAATNLYMTERATRQAKERGLGATPEADALRKTAPKPPAPAVATPSVQASKDLAKQFYDPTEVLDASKRFVESEEADVKAARKRREEGQPQGKAYSKYEEMLQAEEGRSAKERNEATGVAIFKAGLAMMAGTSPRAFENIGKGSLAGLEEYTSAMKDMKKAAKERQKAFADIENARRAEEREDWKAKEAFEEKAATRLSNARKYGVEGLAAATGKGADIAKDLYKLNVEQQGLTERNRAQVNAMLARGAGNEDKQTLSELKALQQSLTKQLESPRMMGPAGDTLRAQLQQINAAIARMAGLGTMPVAPGAGSPGGTMSGWGKASVVNP